MNAKRKILFLSDHPLVPSGVGTQAKYLIEGLLRTGKYQFLCLGGAIEHPDYRPQKIAPDQFGDDWVILPVKGYGDKNIIRQILDQEKPDALFFFTDPRFFVWLWEMEDEIRSVCPMIYWHVWDNDPTPDFNKPFYESTDFIGALSLKTYGLLQDLKYDNMGYIPHSLPAELFKPLPEEQIQEYKRQTFGPHADKKFVAFWNNRNARRKLTGDVIVSFAEFMKLVGKDNVALMMHTAVNDPEGQDIIALARKFGVEQNMIISQDRVSPEDLNKYYNAVDCTINLASNEGFGLATLESLFAGTPIVAHMTGGLQFQMGNWWDKLTDFSNQEKLTKIAKDAWSDKSADWWGVPVFPSARSCTGSQQIPYIYDDRFDHQSAAKALQKLYVMGRQKRRQLGLQAREWATKNFSQQLMISQWDEAISKSIAKFKANPNSQIRTATI